MGTDPTIIAASIVTVVAAIAAAVVTIINAWASANDRRDAKAVRMELKETAHATDKKADTIIEKATEIHTLTNSNLSKVTESLNIALARIEELQQQIRGLARAKDVADRVTSDQTAATKSLRETANNTAAIEKNTR